MKKCSKCSSYEHDDKNVYCTKCGAILETVVESPEAGKLAEPKRSFKEALKSVFGVFTPSAVDAAANAAGEGSGVWPFCSILFSVLGALSISKLLTTDIYMEGNYIPVTLGQCFHIEGSFLGIAALMLAACVLYLIVSTALLKLPLKTITYGGLFGLNSTALLPMTTGFAAVFALSFLNIIWENKLSFAYIGVSLMILALSLAASVIIGYGAVSKLREERGKKSSPWGFIILCALNALAYMALVYVLVEVFVK